MSPSRSNYAHLQATYRHITQLFESNSCLLLVTKLVFEAENLNFMKLLEVRVVSSAGAGGRKKLLRAPAHAPAWKNYFYGRTRPCPRARAVSGARGRTIRVRPQSLLYTYCRDHAGQRTCSRCMHGRTRYWPPL